MMQRSARRVPRLPVLLAVVAVGAAACGTATKPTASGNKAASQYPTHAISWIVPYSPGGGSDISVRRLQPELQKVLGVKINIVYKTGGGGAAGWQDLKSAAPDGYTLANVVDPNIIVLTLKGGAGFTADEFRYVGWTETAPTALAVAKNSRFKTLKDFVDAAKAQPGKLTVAGTGASGQMDLAEITHALGIKVTYVPVSAGVGQIVPQLQGGHVDAAVFGSSHVVEHNDALRALAISGPDSSSALPGVPTFKSLGYAGVNLGTTWGAAMPPNTPEAIAKVFNDALVKVVQMPSIQQKLTQDGLTPLTDNLQQAAARITNDTADVSKAQQLVKSG